MPVSSSPSLQVPVSYSPPQGNHDGVGGHDDTQEPRHDDHEVHESFQHDEQEAHSSLPVYPESNNRSTHLQVEKDSSIEEMEIEGIETAPIQSNPIGVNEIKKFDIVRFKRSNEDNWTTGEILSRAGKCTGKYKTWWNIKDVQSGHQKPEDVQQFASLEKIIVEDNRMETDDVVTYMVNVPFWRYHEKDCVEAKRKELEKFDEFDVYDEVIDEGQKTLGCRWVLTEKFKDGKKCIKARLCVRGDMEDAQDVRTDSPTVRKGNINILLVVAATEGWTITTSDVTAAFLQSGEIERDIFIKPPVERRVPGIIWKLKRTVYGMKDASRGFYLNFSQKLQDFGCEKSLLDPAMFLYFDEDVSRSDLIKNPVGMAVTHVDDVLHCGRKRFEEKIMNPLKESLKLGTEEEIEFRYICLNMKQVKKAIMVDRNHYISNLDEPHMEPWINLKNSDILNDDGQTEFRSAVAKMSMIAYTSRPDLCFEVKSLSTKYGKATKSDLRNIKKKIVLLKAEEGSPMKYPNMGNVNDWVLLGFGDAGIKSMPDKMTSIGGYVVLLYNRMTNATAVLNWRSKKLRRKVTSSLAGECYAMIGIIGELAYIKAVLAQIYGTRVESIPTVVVTDCKNLEEAVHSSSLVEDRWLITDIAAIKEALESKEVTEIKRVPSEKMIANCLTKAGASGVELLEILRTGRYEMPEDWLADNRN